MSDLPFKGLYTKDGLIRVKVTEDHGVFDPDGAWRVTYEDLPTLQDGSGAFVYDHLIRTYRVVEVFNPKGDHILLESGDSLLREDGGVFLLESA